MENKKKKKKRVKTPLIVLAALSGTILLIVLGAYMVFNHFYNKMDYRPLNPNYVVHETVELFTEDVTNGEVIEETSEETPEEELDAYKEAAKEALKNLGIDEYDTEDVYNILLIGSDTRVSGTAGRSDTMILISINTNTKRIVATSFLRDLYVYIPVKDFWNKVNASYAYGGVELLIDTLNSNFSLDIDQYISVDFYSFMKVIDILGGVDVDVQENELYWLNQYIHANNLLLKEENEFCDYLSFADGSYQHLNGKQALAYSRFRYVGNADFTRTERQRKVLNLVFEKLKSIDAVTLIELLNEFLPEVTTNVEKKTFLELLSILPDMFNYEIVSWSIPDTQYKYITIDKVSHLGIDFEHYITKMYTLIYTDTPYSELD